MSSLSPSVNFESFEPAGSAIPFESAQVIFAGDGAHLCTLPLHGARIYQGWTENPRTRQLDRNGDAPRRVDRRKARDHVSRSEVCASAFPFLVASSNRAPAYAHPLERCRPRYPHPEASQGRVREAAITLSLSCTKRCD